MEVVATACQNIWDRRNKVIFEAQFISPNMLFRQTLTQVKIFQQANQDNNDDFLKISRNPNEKRKKWRKLELG